MSAASEIHTFAGWRMGLEFVLWDALQGGSRDIGGFIDFELTDEELDEIRELSELVDGWHIYERFVPMTEWRAILATRG